MYLKLGLRNCLRQKRKTVLTLLTVSIGFACLLLAKGYVHYCLWGLRESIINGGVGHYQVYREGYREKAGGEGYEFLIPEYKKVLRDFSTIPGVAFVAPRLSFSGLLVHGAKSATVFGYGGWNGEEKNLLSFSSLEAGSFPPKDDPYALLAGTGVAKTLHAVPGDVVSLSVAMPSGAVNAVDFTVSGSIGNQLEELENTLAVIPLETAQALLDLPGSVDTLIIMLTDSSRMEMMEDELRACCRRHGLELRRWDDLVPYYQGASAFYSSAMDVAGIVILAIVVFSILNTLLMAVYDRMREFGTMRAVGTRSGQVLRIIGTESVLLALAGCAAGLVIALVAASLINTAGGIPLPPPPGNTRAYRGLIYLDAADAVRYGTLFVLVACAASLIPAVKAVRCSIADTLRWV